MKDRGIRKPGRKFVLIYFEQENHYSTCEAKKVIYDNDTQGIEELIGSMVTVEDLTGKHTGVLKAVGKEQAIRDMETELEVEAMDRSMEIHDSNKENLGAITHAVVCWLKDLKHSRVSLGRIVYDVNKYYTASELVSHAFKTKRRGTNYCDAVVRAVGSEEEMMQQLSFWNSLGGSSLVDFGTQDNADECSSRRNKGENLDFRGSENSHNIGNKPNTPMQDGVASDAGVALNSGNTENNHPYDKSSIYEMDNRKQNKNNRKRNSVDTEAAATASYGAVALIQLPTRTDVVASERILELEEQLRAAKIQLQKERSRKRKLQKLIQEPVGSIGRLIQVGAGLSITESQLEDLLSYKTVPSQYLSYLNRYTGAFSTEVMARSSVKGVKTVTSPAAGPRPALHSAKLAALTSFTIQRCEIVNNEAKMSDLRHKMANMCTNARKSAARKAFARLQLAPAPANPEMIIEME